MPRALVLANHAFRFLLELAAWAALAYAGWVGPASRLLGVLLAVALPVAAAAAWGVFRVPDDPGRAPVPVPGIVRLAIEAATFGGAVLALVLVDRGPLGLWFAAAVLLHYVLAYERVWHVLRHSRGIGL